MARACASGALDVMFETRWIGYAQMDEFEEVVGDRRGVE